MLGQRKEIRLLIIAFIVLTFIAVISKFYSIHLIESQNKLFNKLYDHPLQVSNASLNIQLNIYKIHIHLNNIIESAHDKKTIKDVGQLENQVYKDFSIVQQFILGKEGQILAQDTLTLFNQWKSIHEKRLNITKDENINSFRDALTTQFNEHEVKLKKSTEKLYKYAQKKALGFKEESNDIFQYHKEINFYLVLATIIIFLLIAYYSINRLIKYIKKNDELGIELKNKSMQFEKTFKESPNPIMIHLENGEVYKVNSVWEKLTKYKFSEIDTIEKWTRKAYGKEFHQVKEYIDSLYTLNKSVDEGIYAIKTKDSNVLYWKFSSAPLGIINNQRAVISSAMDVTEMKKKDELMLSQSRSAAMGDMLSMIAHQWRQPLGAISMIANNTLADIELGLLDEKELEDKSNHLLDITQHLSNTINDFKDFFKPNKQKDDVLIRDILEESLKFVKASLKEHDIEYSFESTSTKKISIYPRELMQVMINILINAKEALNEIKNETKSIEIKETEFEDALQITIYNNGNSIDECNLNKIFEPYFSTKNKQNGTGLGLYMSKMIIEDHMQGELLVQNKKDGVMFIITLPII